MSLINEMLKDLAKNKNKVNTKPIDLAGITKQKSSYNFKKNLFSLLYSIIIINFFIIIGIFFYKYKIISPSKITKPLIEASSEIPAISTLALHSKHKKSPSMIAKSQKPIESISKNKVALIKPKESFFIKKYKPLSKRQFSKKQYKKAMLLNDDGIDNEKVIDLLSSIIEKDPEYADARQTLASLLFELNRLKQANEIIDEGIKLFPNHLRFVEIKAQLFLVQNKAKEALSLLGKTLPQLEDEPDYYNLMAVAFEKTGQLSRAGDIYKQLLKLQPNNGGYWLGLALSLEEKSQYNQAISAYKNVIGSYNSSPIIISYAKDRLTALG